MVYDLIILGAGAAGMTASIYASRYKINHLIFGDKLGGQFVDAHLIENYPGFASVDGLTLMTKFREHVESYGVKVREERVGEVRRLESSIKNQESRLEGGGGKSLDSIFMIHDSTPPLELGQFLEIKTESGEKVFTRTLILAMGARHRALNIPGEEKFLGRGVSYCSTCDAPLFRGKVVAVVGGGNSAVTAALHLSEFAQKVYIIHRREVFDKADPVWIDSLDKKENVVKIFNARVVSLEGDTLLRGFRYLRGSAAEEESLAVDGVFIEIGLVPAASLANQLGVEVDKDNYLLASGDLETNVEGVFAAGDLVKQSDVPQLRQIVTSAGQGAIAAASVYGFLNKKRPAPSWG